MRRNTRKIEQAARFPKPASLLNCTAELLRIAQSGNGDAIPKSLPTDISNTLKAIYFNKCAYCENTEHTPEVEHYRPKKGITGLPAHNGYYWLCYEWTNLLPSCHDCNKGGGGKGTKFPIINDARRQSLPIFTATGALDTSACGAHNTPLIEERPYLLHPEIDQPENCLQVNSIGELSGTDAEGRGEKTKEICNLNRENLLVARQKIVDRFKEELEKIIGICTRRNLGRQALLEELEIVIIDHIEGGIDEDKPFSLVALQCVMRYEEIILPLFPNEEERELLINVFQSIVNAATPD